MKNILFYEKCDKTSMPTYSFFIDRVVLIQKLSHKIYTKNNDTDNDTCPIYKQSKIKINNKCTNCIDNKCTNCIINKCSNCIIKKYYKLGNIIWANTLIHKIKHHCSYPSEYFIKNILAMVIVDNYIINPPLQVEPALINCFTYIPLHYNKLLIIDALMHQGSFPRYSMQISDGQEKYIYSEHSGTISIKNNTIDNIIVSAETNRVDTNDETIYLPINTDVLADYAYLFHTHPNTSKYGGRIKEGIIYEFPSANDLFNFIKYHNNGKAQASIVIAPEGIYVIRQIQYQDILPADKEIFYHLRKFILKLEKMAIKKIKSQIDKISDPDFFHHNVGSDFTCIKLYNKFIEPLNLFIEYYPRTKKNGEWCLQQINLPYIEK